MSELRVQIVARTDTGHQRERNEDVVLAADLSSGSCADGDFEMEVESTRGPLLVVCDGMGGAAGGHVASSTAATVICQSMRESPATEEMPVLARHLRRAVRSANRALLAKASEDRELAGMGTTVSAMALVGATAVIAQIGDSRAYVLRQGGITQVTRDQSVVSAMVHAGHMSEEQAKYSMQRGVVLQALGAHEDVDVSLSLAELRRGDRLLLCSDGLHGLIPDKVIAAANEHDELADAADQLIKLALAAGGHDNVTVLLAEVSGGTLRRPMPDDQEPRFVEYDPSVEGEDAMTNTSLVAHRLAHKAGFRKSAPKAIPATDQHDVISKEEVQALLNPASAALDEQSATGRWPWVLAACVLVAGLGYALAFWL